MLGENLSILGSGRLLLLSYLSVESCTRVLTTNTNYGTVPLSSA